MSTSLIARSRDLSRLRAEGYNIAVQDGHLVIRDIPYLNANRDVRRGSLACPLDLAGDSTTTPETHVMKFAGEYPCAPAGQPLEAIRHATIAEEIGGEALTFSFSSKPASGGYPDYYDKVTIYASIISDQARALDPDADPRTFTPIETSPEESMFVYEDTASARAGTVEANVKLKGQRVAIIGMGGTGAYILDAVAKTPVAEIHLFDGDRLLTHNAFRAPGAVPLSALQVRPTKVEYWASTYANLRRGIVPHPYPVTIDNVSELEGMNVIFIAVDESAAKRPIIEHLEQSGATYIDCGMGLTLTPDNRVRGQVRATTSTPSMRDHVHALGRIPLGEIAGDDAYSTNLQVGEMNALNAILAVVRWKKLAGFYVDSGLEHDMNYILDGNEITNQDRGAA